jgi:DNA replication protein DnaC
MSNPVPISERLKKRAPGIKDKPEKPYSWADPNCSICHGFGWKLSKVYDTWFICDCSTTMRAKLEAERNKPDYSTFGIQEDELCLNWSDIVPGVSDADKAMPEIRNQFIRGWGMIFLWGTYGQAKTLLGKILTARAIEAGRKAAYANVSTVLDHIRLAYDEKEHMMTELLRRSEFWNNRDVLFLDELDKASTTEWAQDRLFQLLDQRYVRAIRGEALTVIASNKSTDALDGYLKSRLSDTRLGPVIYLNGEDGRQFMPESWKH